LSEEILKSTEQEIISSPMDTIEYSAEFVLDSDTKTLEQTKTPLLDAMQNYYNNPSVQLHIPGHTKGKAILPKFKDLIGAQAVFFDATDEHDNVGTLHPADGPIAEAQKLAAEAFGAGKSYFLLNGSTIGNMALALTLTRTNDKIIVGRNCHRSITNGLILSGANPVWVYPEKLQEWSIWGAVTPETIENAIIQNPDAKAVWVTNPTYEGVISDIEAIAAICKKYDKLLLVDEAHGSLWKFNEHLPKTALECGADAVVNSMHKTGGSFSQSSILHVSKNTKINLHSLEANLKMLHSTSPSLLLLASLDAARAYLTSELGHQDIENCVQNSIYLREMLKNIPEIKCLSGNDKFSIDPTKIYLMIDGLSGKRLESILEFEYNIDIESTTDNGILALSNIGNTRSDIEYFCECLKSIVKNHYSDITYLEKTKYMPLLEPKIVLSPRDAYHREKEDVPLKNIVGRISGELIAECPPGISVLVPGELITEEHLPYLTKYKTITVLK